MRCTPRANAIGQAIAEVRWGPSSDSAGEQPPTAAAYPKGSAVGVPPAAAAYPTGSAVGGGCNTHTFSLAPAEPAIEDESWAPSSASAGEQPPAAAVYPTGSAVGGGCAAHSSVPVPSPPGLETLGTTPKSASTAMPKPPPVEPPWAHKSRAQLRPRTETAGLHTCDASTQTDLRMLAPNPSGDLSFELISGPSQEELRKHVKQCRWLAWQIQMAAIQEKRVALGKTKTQVRRQMRKNAEEAQKAKAEEASAEEAQQDKEKQPPIPDGPSSRTRRRKQSRATKRAAMFRQVESDTSETTDAKDSKWTTSGDGGPTTSTKWQSWWHQGWWHKVW